MTKEEILKSKGFETPSLPKDYYFTKAIVKETHTVELQITLNKNLEFKSAMLDVFIEENSYTFEEKLNYIYDSVIDDINELKKLHIEVVNLLKFK